MEINIVDTVDPSLGRVWLQLVSLNQDPIEIKNGADGVERMVNEVISKVKQPRSIDVLRIFSHGNAGIFVITGGDTSPEPTSLLATWNLSRCETTLRRLTPYFKPTARVELLCCYVATESVGDDGHEIRENSDGEQLIRGLARIWQVRVFASGNTKKGLPIGSLNFVGLVVRADPDGGLSCCPAPEIKKLAKG